MYTTIKWNLLAVSLCWATVGMAQEDNALKPKPEAGMELTTEVQATTSGDMNFANLLRLNASVPLSRNLMLEAASLSTYMTAAESIGGDMQTFSNLDAGNIPFALSVCDVEWQIDDHQTLYAGIRNMNEDYFTSPVTSLFTNSSCGIFPTISANYPIANYPVASVGVHYRYENVNESEDENENRGKRFAVQASVYNGVGYNRFCGRENVFRVCPKSDGVFALAQTEYERNGSGYYLGACGRYGDSSEGGKRLFSTALWGYAEQYLSHNLSLIASYSHAFASAECSDFVGIGGKWSLGNAELGVFQDYACFSECKEWATELTCRISVSQHLQIQPTAHFIVTGNKTKAVGAFRAVLSL